MPTNPQSSQQLQPQEQNGHPELLRCYRELLAQNSLITKELNLEGARSAPGGSEAAEFQVVYRQQSGSSWWVKI